MITVEKLKELIKKEATIFYVDYFKNIKEFKLDATYMITYDIYNQQEKCLGSYNGTYTDENNEEVEDIDRYDFEDLFETKSEAEFYAKYGNIEKIVKMPVPPTWEEFKNIQFYKCAFWNLRYEFYEAGQYMAITLNELDTGEEYILYHFDPTVNGYYDALRKMVELWKEEV